MRLSEQYEIINRFRKTAPVDVERLADAIGVFVRRAYLDPDISGMIEYDSFEDHYVITVNASDPYTRQRFTVSHELGHYMLHRRLIGEGIDDDRAYRSTSSGKHHNTSIGPTEETQANRFAADVLMPYDLIEAERKLRSQTGDPASLVSELADKFSVSLHAMSIRLGVPFSQTGL